MVGPARGDSGGGFDLLLTPTLAEPPVPLGTFDPAPDNPMAGLHAGGGVHAIHAAGQHHRPAGDLPSALPNRRRAAVGVQLIAAYGREDLLLRVAAQLEEAVPWAHRRPPISIGG